MQKNKSKTNLNPNNNQERKTYMGKVIILGNSSVGKTSIVTRYTWNGQGAYQLSHTPTIGVDFKSKTVDLKTCLMKLQLWDTAGQQRFRNMTDHYYTGASGIVLVYSITDRKSFQQVSDWIYQISNKADQEAVKIILANKCDVCGRNSVSDQKRVVQTYEGRMLGEKYNANFFEVSAKQNINIDLAFTYLAEKMVQKVKKEGEKSRSSVLVLDKKKQEQVLKKTGCC